MKHKLKIFAVITALTISFTGCYPTGEKELPSNGSAEDSQPFSGKISENFGDVELDYEISAGFPKTLPKIGLKQKVFDTELCKSVLLRGKTILPTEEGSSDWVFHTTDDCMLAVAGTNIRFYDEKIINRLKCFGFFSATWSHYYRTGDVQLKSFSSAEAVERVNKILDELGIENYGEPYVITVTPEGANAYFDELDEAGYVKVSENDYSDPRNEYIPWDEDDGLYILKYPFNYNGIELCPANLKTAGTSRMVNGACISVSITKNGITDIRVDTLYDVISLDEGTADLKFDAKYASDQLAEHYSKISAVDKKTFFYDCKLEYVPFDKTNGEVIFTPAWCFMAYDINYNEDGSEIYSDKIEIYYAETGRSYGGY